MSGLRTRSCTAVKLQSLLAPTSNSKQHANRKETSATRRPSARGFLGAERLTGRLLEGLASGHVLSTNASYTKDRRHNDDARGKYRFSYFSSRNDKDDCKEALQFVLQHSDFGELHDQKSSNRTRNRIMLYIHLAFEGLKILLDSSGQTLDTLQTTRLASVDQSTSSNGTVMLLGRVDRRHRFAGTYESVMYNIFHRPAVSSMANRNLRDSLSR
jgi:hypothetical protein